MYPQNYPQIVGRTPYFCTVLPQVGTSFASCVHKPRCSTSALAVTVSAAWKLQGCSPGTEMSGARWLDRAPQKIVPL